MTCPTCNSPLNGSTDDGDTRPPRDGDLSLCIHCATLCAFTDQVTRLRLATPQELAEAEQHPGFVQTRFNIIIANTCQP